ncbi:PAAR domain-containing protein [Pseudomonas crudilactis]|uniref:PAAR domain-containing protein n=1 Tax=Pseudomonas crudilactis TaxID=2697028 RepID=UPI0015D9FE47|nr:PAAR domain-containing protein [Pseudomonas crudilactis]
MSGKPAARVSDPTACPLPGHGTNPIAAGSGDVFFDGLAAARQGDASACGGAMVGGLATTVKINGKSAVTVDSVGSHGNKVTAGSSTVIIGNSHSPAPFVPPLPLMLFSHTQQVVMEDQDGNPLSDIPYQITTSKGKVITGQSDAMGRTELVGGKEGETFDFHAAIDGTAL